MQTTGNHSKTTILGIMAWRVCSKRCKSFFRKCLKPFSGLLFTFYFLHAVSFPFVFLYIPSCIEVFFFKSSLSCVIYCSECRSGNQSLPQTYSEPTETRLISIIPQIPNEALNKLSLFHTLPASRKYSSHKCINDCGWMMHVAASNEKFNIKQTLSSYCKWHIHIKCYPAAFVP